MKTRNSLTFKLSIIILSVVLLIFAIIVLFNYKVSQNLLIEDAKKDARYITKLTISQIQDVLGTVEEPVNLFSKYISENNANSTQLQRVVELMVINSDKIASSLVYYFQKPGDTTRIKHYYQHAGENTNKRENAYPEQILSTWREELNATRKPYWSEPRIDSETGELTSNYIVPMFESGSGVTMMLGMIAIEFRLVWLKEFLQNNKTYDSDYIFILSREGRPVVMPGDMFTFNKTILQVAKENNLPEIYELGQKMTAGKSGSFEMHDLVDSEKSVVYYEPVPATNWSIGVVFPKSELFMQLDATTFQLGTVGLMGFLLILIFTILILRRQTSPLRQLSTAAKEIGQGRFDVQMPYIHSRDEVGILRDSLQNMQDELKLYIKNLINTTREKERFEGELSVAQQIQMGYLRRDFDGFSKNKGFTLSALLKPAREVGGDFYDFFKIDSNKICIAIGDVAGKGVPAALFMTVALTLTRSGNYLQSSLASVVGKINNELCRRNEDAYFVTAFYGVLDLSNGEMVFCNAGHNYPYLVKSGELFEVQGTHGPALGISESVIYKTGKLKFEPGNTIVLYTDGIPDAENKRGEFFNKTRLEDALRQNVSNMPNDITRKLYQKIKKYSEGEPQSDDLTIMALKFGSENALSTD
jgi:sigma-B regulation protein RsbU (phosphoserine phosphatase)